MFKVTEAAVFASVFATGLRHYDVAAAAATTAGHTLGFRTGDTPIAQVVHG